MSDTEITADAVTLLRQASMTACDYMDAAIGAIDHRLGEGFARANSSLIAGFMQAAALDFHSAILAQQIRLGLREQGNDICTRRPAKPNKTTSSREAKFEKRWLQLRIVMFVIRNHRSKNQTRRAIPAFLLPGRLKNSP
jgi:hypothetical protein